MRQPARVEGAAGDRFECEPACHGLRVERSAFAALPGCPAVPAPQPYASPASVSPQVWEPPAPRESRVRSPATSWGVGMWWLVLPVPSCPSLSCPQQYVLVADTPQV